ADRPIGGVLERFPFRLGTIRGGWRSVFGPRSERSGVRRRTLATRLRRPLAVRGPDGGGIQGGRILLANPFGSSGIADLPSRRTPSCPSSDQTTPEGDSPTASATGQRTTLKPSSLLDSQRLVRSFTSARTRPGCGCS